MQPGTNGVRVEATGTAGWGYGIVATNHLVTNHSTWVSLGGAVADGAGRIVFTDTNANATRRFYRAVYP